MVKPKSKKLPNQLVIFPNKDKLFHEKPKKDDLAHMAHPSRIIACGPCNVGKSLVFFFLNLAMHADPLFDRIVIFHNDGESEEYEQIDAEFIDEVPTIDFFDKKEKTLLIFEDIPFKDMKRATLSLVDRYYGWWSTHHNISVWSTFQDPFSCPPRIRRLANIVILWDNGDADSMSELSRKVGLTSKDLRCIFDNNCTDFHDSLIIDKSRSYAKLRKNIFEVIPYRKK